MSAHTTTYAISCPLFCGGESTLTIRGYDHPVTVRPCAACTAQGGTPFQVGLGQAEHYLPKAEATVLRHRDGLVAFAG